MLGEEQLPRLAEAAPMLPEQPVPGAARERRGALLRHRRLGAVAALGMVLVLAVVALAAHGMPGRASSRTAGAISLLEKGKAKLRGDESSPCDSKDPPSKCRVKSVDPDDDWLEEVKKLDTKADAMGMKAQKVGEAAQEVGDKAQVKIDSITAVKDDAGRKWKDADDLKEEAKSMRKEARQKVKDSEQAQKEAGELEKKAKEKEKKFAGIIKKAADAQKAADSEWAKVNKVKDKAKKELEKHRECFDMPGIRLNKGNNTLMAVEGDDAIWNAEICRRQCMEDMECQQVVWVGWKNGCYLYGELSTDPIEFKDVYNSSYCGDPDEHDHLKEMLDTTYKQVPYNPPIQVCSWSGEDCSQTNCCNDVQCDKEFSNCRGYTCFRQDDYFAGCLLDPAEEGWNNEIIGGPRETREVQPADEGVKVQGSTLFCFSVINWDAPAPKSFWATEGELADHIKKHKVSIFQCDEADFFSGYQTPQADWGSFSNIDAFVDVWKDVKNDGRWMKYDWTVKVDADAVFIPDRLREHLVKLRTPKNARVYLKNINYQFQFMGALEVMTKEALELYFDKGEECIRGEHQGGEDFFMRGCLDAIGVDHMVDFDLLRDKYCVTCPDRDDACLDGTKVAYHFHKKIVSWNWCYNEVVCGDAWGKCGDGIKVEFVMDHSEKH